MDDISDKDIDALDEELHALQADFSADKLETARKAAQDAERGDDDRAATAARIALARLQIASPDLAEVRSGIEALQRLSGSGMRQEEAMFLECEGLLLSGQFDRARARIGTLTTTFPAWDRGVCLREVFRRRVHARAPQGFALLAAGAGAAVLLGIALWWYLSSPRRKPAQSTH